MQLKNALQLTHRDLGRCCRLLDAVNFKIALFDFRDGALKDLGVDKTWGSCSAFAVWDGQATVEDSGSGDGNSVSSFWRPPHPSALSHPGIGNVIGRNSGTR